MAQGATVRPVGAIAIAIALGVLAGLATGGRPSLDHPPSLRLWPALLLGVVLQWVPELLGASESAAFPAVVGSSLSLAAFAVANLRLTGIPVVLVGLVLNMAVIFPNGGMPVRPSAVVRAGIVGPGQVVSVDFGSKRHLERDDDVLVLLGDVVPLAPLGEVLSLGDLVLAAGVANVVFRLLRPTTPVTGPRAARPAPPVWRRKVTSLPVCGAPADEHGPGTPDPGVAPARGRLSDPPPPGQPCVQGPPRRAEPAAPEPAAPEDEASSSTAATPSASTWSIPSAIDRRPHGRR